MLMIPIPSSAIATQEELSATPSVVEKAVQQYQLTVHNTHDSFWALVRFPKRTEFRMAYSPGNILSLMDSINIMSSELRRIVAAYIRGGIKSKEDSKIHLEFKSTPNIELTATLLNQYYEG